MRNKRKMKESTTPPQKKNNTGDTPPSPMRPMPHPLARIVSASAEPSPDQRHRLHAAVDALLVEMVRREIGRRKGS
jgi:hypothetical protein